MSCDQTPHLIADYFDDHADAARRQQIDQHLLGCADCQQAVHELSPAAVMLAQWRDEPVPQWKPARIMQQDKGMASSPNSRHDEGGQRPAAESAGRARWLQWGPLAASLVMAVAVVFQVQINVNDQGWQLSFAGRDGATMQTQSLDNYLADFAEQQQLANQQMVEQALAQFGETSADSLVQLVQYIEQQREQDMRQMEAGFRQLLNRNYQTVNSVQQLTSFVQYQEAQ